MLSSSTKKRLGVALVAATTLCGAAFSAGAKADPKQYTALVGVGSDTVQDVFNAFANGYNDGTADHLPIQSSVGTGSRQVVSFNALNPINAADTCITGKLNGPTFDRPNGSGAGQKALSRAIDGTKWGSAACGGPVDVSGQVDFGRSSSGSSNLTATDLTFVPFGRDALSFAYYKMGNTVPAVTSLTKAQLASLFTTGPQTIGGVWIVPCGIQSGSGTYKFWNKALGSISSVSEASATADCNALFPSNGLSGRAEENNGQALKDRGDTWYATNSGAHPDAQVIIGFSAAAFIAKSNGVAPGTPPAGVGIGSISNNGSAVDIGSPVTGTAPTLTPNATFFNDTTFGRKVYTVWQTSVLTGLGNDDIKSLVVGTGSAVCSATTTIEKFGFLSLGADCGTTTETGPLVAGQTN
jgi:ABC-type phosphate transport system substrate-binding protein